MISYVQHKNINFEKLKNLLNKSTNSNQFTNLGPAKTKLEAQLEEALKIDKSKKVVCVSNGTLALHAIYLYYMDKNIKWVSPSFTFPSCSVGGFNTDIVDIDHKTYTMPLNDYMLKKYDGFLITNLFGTYPKNIKNWISKCKEKNKILVFDNASSPMTEIDGINYCNFGDFSFGSLHHTKYLGFGEGGFLVCPKDVYDDFNRICGFGFQKINGKRIFSKNSSNFKMSDVSAAAILQHISRYNIDLHIRNQNKLLDLIDKIDGVNIFNFQEGVVLGNLPLIFNKAVNVEDFDSSKVEVQKYYKPIKSTTNSEFIFSKIINMPLNESLTSKDFLIIENEIKNVLSKM